MAQAVTPHVPKSQQGLARTSVGRLWPDTEDRKIPQEMIYALQEPRRTQNDGYGRLRRIYTPGQLHYRNSVLSMLLRSQHFLAYVRSWHLVSEARLTAQYQHADNALQRLATISRRLEGDRNGVQGMLLQHAISDEVRAFWRETFNPGIAPRIVHNVPHTTRPFWNTTNGSEPLRNAAEWLLELLGIIRDQLQAAAGLSPVIRAEVKRFEWLCYSKLGARQICRRCQFDVRLRIPDNQATTNLPCLRINLPPVIPRFATLKRPQPLQQYIAREMKRTPLQRVGCPRCNSVINGTVHYTFRRAPEILFIKIQREIAAPPGANNVQLGKNPQSIEIPEVLHLTQFLDPHEFGKNSNVQYSLSGMVSHQGQSFGGGEYISFVRGGQNSDEWWEVDNASAQQRGSFEEFNDSRTMNDYTRLNDVLDEEGGVATPGLKGRAMPYILMYERDNVNSKITPGRPYMNANEGQHQDVQPTSWYPGVTPQDDPDAEAIQNNTIDQFSDEEDADMAELNLAVNLDGIKMRMPKHFIRKLDPGAPRVVKLEGSLTTRPTQGRKRKLDLAEAHNDAESERRTLRRRRLTAPPGDWNGRWRQT